jgi:hypothetical protein
LNVLPSLIEDGYEVFIADDMIFTPAVDAHVAKARLRQAGAIFVTYKMLYYELLRSVLRPELPNEVLSVVEGLYPADPE